MKKWKSIVAIATAIPLFFQPIHCYADEKACYLTNEQIEYCFEAQEAFGISATLIASIIQTESSGRSNAINGQCKGLMQVSEVHVSDPDDLFDMDQNIRFGVSILDEYINKADGELYLALMYYNGVSNAQDKFDRWLRNGAKGYPTDYVRKVCETQKNINEEWYGL